MKINLTILLFLTSYLMHPQTDLRDGKHVFNYPITLTECNFDGSAISGRTAKSEIMQRNWNFKIENIVDSKYIIHVSMFKNDNQQNLQTYRTDEGKKIYFIIPSTMYADVAEKLTNKGKFIVGASSTLLKIRPGNNEDGEDAIFSEFGNDFNIGLTAGWQITPYRKTEFSIAIVGGLGYSSIKVTPQTTRSFVSSEASQSSITFNGGFIFEIEKFQISAFIGIDTMSGEVGRNWIYRNRPWIGLGFGYEIFKHKGDTDN